MSALYLVALLLLAMGSFITLSLIIGFMVGHRRGVATGRALQWQDDYFEAARKESARRNELGQFKAKGGK